MKLKKVIANYDINIIIMFLVFILIFFFSFLYLNSSNNNVGHHLIVDIENIEHSKLTSSSFILKLCEDIIKSTNINVLKSLVHKFKPYGMTALYLLAESHFAIHTWPEKKKICLDLFSCSKKNKFDKAIDVIKKYFPDSKLNITKINR
tara:strand:+ start:1125 stop:1568 length:444 start_codon:yes stop_codon:yes gene_type:complete